MTYTIKCVPYKSADYEQTVALRDTILRKPLGMIFTPEQLAAESNQIHVACFNGANVVGCMVLLFNDAEKKVKMRQVAVVEYLQKQGIGKMMLDFLDNWAKERDCRLIYCHARDVAAPFYDKYGYVRVGESFEEVGITHWRMEREVA